MLLICLSASLIFLQILAPEITMLPAKKLQYSFQTIPRRRYSAPSSSSELPIKQFHPKGEKAARSDTDRNQFIRLVKSLLQEFEIVLRMLARGDCYWVIEPKLIEDVIRSIAIPIDKIVSLDIDDKKSMDSSSNSGYTRINLLTPNNGGIGQLVCTKAHLRKLRQKLKEISKFKKRADHHEVKVFESEEKTKINEYSFKIYSGSDYKLYILGARKPRYLIIDGKTHINALFEKFRDTFSEGLWWVKLEPILDERIKTIRFIGQLEKFAVNMLPKFDKQPPAQHSIINAINMMAYDTRANSEGWVALNWRPTIAARAKQMMTQIPVQ